jgi:hypothetical protein
LGYGINFSYAGGEMFPFDASRQFIVKVGAGSTGHAQQWFFQKFYNLIKESRYKQLSVDHNAIVYKSTVSSSSHWNLYLAASNMGYIEILDNSENIIINYKILFHSKILEYLYCILLGIVIIPLFNIPLFPWILGLIVVIVVLISISYYGTLMWFNMIIREYVRDYLFRQKQGDFAIITES